MTDSNETPYFLGTVKAIFFENPENLYKIFTIKIKKQILIGMLKILL